MTRHENSFTDPIPTDGRLIRAVRRAHDHARTARLLITIARDTGNRLERHHERFEFPDPVDIRGIPATGRGVSGTIRGTQPESRIAGRDT